MLAAQATEESLPVKTAVKIVELMEPTMAVDEVAVGVEADVRSTDIATLLEGKKIQGLCAKKEIC
jgi:hypothetical protein